MTGNHKKTIKKKRISQYPDYKKNDVVFFTYKCFKSEQSCDAKLWHHTGQVAKVLRKLPKRDVDESIVGQMYHIQFKDGFTYDVVSDELQLIKRRN
jgi:hypothetical protein